MRSGVLILSSGSRIIREAPRDGCPNSLLWFVRVSVAPAKGEYSPPEREVGIFMMGRAQGVGFGGLDARAERSSRLETLFARPLGKISLVVMI